MKLERKGKLQNLLSCDSVALIRVPSSADANPFGAFEFSGPLRPMYPLSAKRGVPEHIPRPDYADDGRVKSFIHSARDM